MTKLWGGRFTKSGGKALQEYWNSISFDYKLAKYDIQGSLAHVAMLEKTKIIPGNEAEQIRSGLNSLLKKVEAGELNFTQDDEDVHMNVERHLHQLIGAVAGKLHTARSRNDQVALDMHLFLREQCLETIRLLRELQGALLGQVEKNPTVMLPGYTHLQRAQPVLLAHHLLAYVQMLQRDAERLVDSWKRINLSPLGAGAIAGTTFPIDRDYVAQLLHFDGVYENSMDAVSDRDFVAEFIFDNALIMTHLSRLCEELLLWTSYEFGFATVDDAFSTGSSMMPQKKNADLAELVRGKTGRVYGSLIGLLTVLKGLPLTYNKDMQEDKEGVFDTVETVQGALLHLSGMVETLTFHPERMYQAASTNFTNATDLADYLAKRGMPFREAHEVVGKMVLWCVNAKRELLDLSLSEFKNFSPLFEEDVYPALKIETVVGRRNSRGGTSPEQVKLQLERINAQRAETGAWLAEMVRRISA